MCFHNNDGLCGKDLIVMDVEAGTLTCTDCSYEDEVEKFLEHEEDEDDSMTGFIEDGDEDEK